MKYFRIILSGIVTLIALIAWITTRHVGSVSLTVFDIFPLFGLLAFSLMWVQVVSGAVAKYSHVTLRSNRHLDGCISGLVLSLTILHPVTVWVALYLSGAGLPPESYLSTYGVNGIAVTALLFGTVSLCIFLSYELRRWFAKKSWWRYVLWLQTAALVLIFFHALVLGGEAGHGWFRVIWIAYGVLLGAAVVYTYYIDRKKGAHL